MKVPRGLVAQAPNIILVWPKWVKLNSKVLNVSPTILQTYLTPRASFSAGSCLIHLPAMSLLMVFSASCMLRVLPATFLVRLRAVVQVMVLLSLCESRIIQFQEIKLK